MSDKGSMIPISDEQANLGQEIIKALGGVAVFVKEALGSTPQDLIGYLGGDWLRVRRAENIAKIMTRSKEKLEARGVKDHAPASLTVALPILRGAANESREALQDLWAGLLAAAIDPSRSNGVRQSFAEAISKMEPPDALVLSHFKKLSGSTANYNQIAGYISISPDVADISMGNLAKLGLLAFQPGIAGAYLTSFGREFLRIVTD